MNDSSGWIKCSDRIPDKDSFVIAYHTIHGIGVAWIWKFDEGTIEELEEDFKDKYICSYEFIKPEKDGNFCIDNDEPDDVFEHSPHFKNLGTLTHWMPFPKPPTEKNG